MSLEDSSVDWTTRDRTNDLKVKLIEIIQSAKQSLKAKYKEHNRISKICEKISKDETNQNEILKNNIM